MHISTINTLNNLLILAIAIVPHTVKADQLWERTRENPDTDSICNFDWNDCYICAPSTILISARNRDNIVNVQFNSKFDYECSDNDIPRGNCASYELIDNSKYKVTIGDIKHDRCNLRHDETLTININCDSAEEECVAWIQGNRAKFIYTLLP